jgi:hypothetical protein
MIEQEHRLIREPFTDHLTAFLAAGMSVRDPFKAVKAWCEDWKESLTPDQRRIWGAMRIARNDEAHITNKSRPAKSRSSRKRAKESFPLCVGHEEINVGVGSPYFDTSGRVEGFGSPALLLTLGVNTNVVIHKEIYFFVIDRKNRKVTEVCAE